MSQRNGAVDNALRLLNKLNGKELSRNDFQKLFSLIVQILLGQDRRYVGDIQAQYDYFKLMSCEEDAQLLTNSIGHRMLFQAWVNRSANPFAAAYRMGAANSNHELIQANVKRAANGRRLIGATTREKVRLEAIKHRHKSKEQAAADMAANVNLSIGHIKRLLSDLFPGDSWRTDDATKR